MSRRAKNQLKNKYIMSTGNVGTRTSSLEIALPRRHPFTVLFGFCFWFSMNGNQRQRISNSVSHKIIDIFKFLHAKKIQINREINGKNYINRRCKRNLESIHSNVIWVWGSSKYIWPLLSHWIFHFLWILSENKKIVLFKRVLKIVSTRGLLL